MIAVMVATDTSIRLDDMTVSFEINTIRLNKCRRRVITQAETGRLHPDGAARIDLDVITIRAVRMRRSDGPLQRLDELVRALTLTGDVVANVQHARRAGCRRQ